MNKQPKYPAAFWAYKESNSLCLGMFNSKHSNVNLNHGKLVDRLRPSSPMMQGKYISFKIKGMDI